LFISPAIWRSAGIEVDFNHPMVGKAGPFSGHAAVVPEPATYAPMIAGLAAGAWARRRNETLTATTPQPPRNQAHIAARRLVTSSAWEV